MVIFEWIHDQLYIPINGIDLTIGPLLWLLICHVIGHANNTDNENPNEPI